MHKGKALIELRLADLVLGNNELDFTCKAGDFNDPQLTGAGFKGVVQVRVAAEKSEGGITVTTETSTAADLTCDICLAPVSKVLTGSLRLYYFYDAPPEENQNVDEECRFLERSSESIDITEDVREILLLSLPMKVTCTDNPECRLYGREQEDEGTQAGEKSSWHESLKKLKNKYR